MDKKNIYGIINKFINEYNISIIKLNKIFENGKLSGGAGGKIRGNNGKLVENLTEMLFHDILKEYNIDDYSIINGKSDLTKVSSKNGYIKVGVDRHIHIPLLDFHIYVECKSYLDKCYMDRANSDLMHLKNNNNNSLCLIISLENSIKDTSLDYFLDQGYIDNVFFLLDGKRSSKEPYWITKFNKQINKNNLKHLINYIESEIKKRL